MRPIIIWRDTSTDMPPRRTRSNPAPVQILIDDGKRMVSRAITNRIFDMMKELKQDDVCAAFAMRVC